MSDHLEQSAINTIRFLAVDAVQAARSGHPGAPLGLATAGYALFAKVMKHNPIAPTWPDRDRFVLSNGHASALLYALLHLSGYDLSLDDIRNFRQLHSPTAGHPEYGEAPGVEITTGPLGQGFAHGVGMALAEAWMARQFNKPGHEIVDHFTYGIVSDGDLEEGISYEAASLAGHWGLGKLIYLYDSNAIQIEGSTGTNFSEDVAARFRAQHWHVQGPIDGNDTEALCAAFAAAQGVTGQPSLIIANTVIGYGSPLAGSEKTHGSPLGEENVAKTKEALGFPTEPPFYVSDAVREHFALAAQKGAQAQQAWEKAFDAYAAEYPDLAAKLHSQWAGELPDAWDEGLDDLFAGQDKPLATRAASGTVLNYLAPKIDFLLGGSADLAPSNNTFIKGRTSLAADNLGGRNVHFGVREHAMGAIAGGMALHGGIIPYTGTFFTFSDYMRTPMRLAALMGIRVVYVFTHDSIGLGEDGPTHQPVEHLMACRVIPNLTVIRPADAAETVVAWKTALTRTDGPTALVLTRQGLPILDRSVCGPAAGAGRGAYVLWESDENPELILIGTGSEVSLALEAANRLADEGVKVRVVSMPSWELFDAQPAAYRDEVLPPAIRARVAVEAGATTGWEKYVGLDGSVIGMQSFGASGPIKDLFAYFGFTVENVIKRAKGVLGK
ncbi:MAG: transketolase [Candidatus Lernaella stagnicola]|nr:transketolase [Candidatus Lernaella stagnicola]